MSDQIQRTRQFVQRIFSEMGSQDSSLCETVLIADGNYCGHRFSCDEYNAIWFFEEHEVKIYDADRKLLRVESLDSRELGKAA